MIGADGKPVDLEMCAYDLAKTLAKFGYLNVSPDAIRPESLARFLGEAVAAQRQLDDAEWENGGDAVRTTPTPAAELAPSGSAVEAPKYGRVRVCPQYIFAAVGSNDPEIDEIWITDLDKKGRDWARTEAVQEAAKIGATVGRLLRTEQYRWRPYAGTPRDAKPW